MKINALLKEEIRADIKRCNQHTSKNGSMELYNNLIAKYVVVDPEIEKGLSVMGKVASLRTEYDYRPELKALANKLHMLLVLNDDIQESSNPNQIKIKELINRGEIIGKEEYHEMKGGYPFSYVSGPKYDVWMGEINLFNERCLKKHPAYESISIFYKQRDNNPNAFNRMMAQLKVVDSDIEFWSSAQDVSNVVENDEVVKNNKVFIVHGHDNSAKLMVARFLENCGFEAIILHEQPDGGKTIIEKIEYYTDVVYAIVLYTPCDVGHAKEETTGKARARQNVVFEHGYLIGRLGRDKVCALVKQDIETPGDMSGVVYKPMDSAGAWKTEILKEMKNAGIPVDASKLL